MTRANPTRELSSTAKKNLTTLWNHLNDKKTKQPDSYSWVYANHAQLYKILTQPRFAVKTQKSYLCGLISGLQFLKKDHLAGTYIKHRDELQKKIDYEYGENEATVKHVGSFEELLLKRNGYSKVQNKSIQDNYLFLITCMNTYIPPLRKEIRKVEFIKTKLFEKFRRSIKQTKQHFLFFNKDGNMVLALGEFKSHPPIDITLPKILEDVITHSFDKFPRRWLFADYKDKIKPISNPEFVKLLKILDLGDESNYRSLYYSHQLKKNPHMSQNKKREIADSMRNSVEMLDKVYRKITTTETETPTEKQDLLPLIQRLVKSAVREQVGSPVEQKEENEPRGRPGPVPREKNKNAVCRASKKYYDNNPIKGRAIRYVYKINAGKFQASPNKIEEYKLSIVNGKWASGL